MKNKFILLLAFCMSISCNSSSSGSASSKVSSSNSIPSFMKDYPLGKTEAAVASDFGGLMINRTCTKENFEQLKKMFGGKEAKCMMFNSKGYGAQVLRSFYLTDGIVRKGNHDYVDTSTNLNNHKNAMKLLDPLVNGVKPTYVWEGKKLHTKYNRFYVATWEWDTGFSTANVMCTMIPIGDKWEFPVNIRNCYAFKVQYQYKTEQNQIDDVLKVNDFPF